MFDFFDGFIGELKLRLIKDFSNKVSDFVMECLKKLGKNEKEGQDYSQLASSGDSSQLASSGYASQLASSGDYSQLASSGYYSQIASSGYASKLASSGDYSQLAITGKNSVAFAAGYKNTIKASKGTWISLVEYEVDEQERWVPIFAKSAQIGNKEYRDNRNRILKANTEYALWKKEFYELKEVDGIETLVISEKKRDNIKIIKAIDFSRIYHKEEPTPIYIVGENKIYAHGYSLREAIDDLTYKKMKKVDSEKIIADIKATEKVTRSQYRALTGACSFGTDRFCKEHNIQDLEEIDINELRKILIDDYGAKKFWSLIDGNEKV